MTTVLRPEYPRAGHRVGVAMTPSGRLLDYGDLARVIPQWEQTPLIASTPKPTIHRQRFVPMKAARAWVKDLTTKQHLTQAKALTDLIEWAETIYQEKL